MASKQYDGVNAYENNCSPNIGTKQGLTGYQRLTDLFGIFYFTEFHLSNCCFSLQTWQTGPLFQINTVCFAYS